MAPDPRQPFLSPPAPPSPASPLDEARRSALDLASFFRSLGSADGWAAGASAALLLALALPWRWSPDEDDVIGLVWTSRPLIGSYLGLACAAAALVASLPARIRRER